MIPGGTPNPPLRRVVDAPFTSKSHFGLLFIKLFKQYTHNIIITLYKINPSKIKYIP